MRSRSPVTMSVAGLLSVTAASDDGGQEVEWTAAERARSRPGGTALERVDGPAPTVGR